VQQILKISGGILLGVLLLVSCAAAKLETKQQATIWLNVYNAEYDDTMAIMTNPASTPAQREIGAKKKAVLAKIWPLLRAYVAVVDTNGTPDDQTVQRLTELINELSSYTIGGQ